MSVYGIELRRSAALGAALLTVAVGVGALYAAPGRWAAGWMTLAMTSREYLLLLWPLALAAGAWQGRREHRAKVGELFATTPRSRLRRILPVVGAMAVTLAVAYLLMTAAGIAWIVTTAAYVPVLNFTVVTAVGALSLVAAAWLGLAIGRMLPALVTAPAVGVAGVLLVFLSAIRLPDWLAAAVSPVHGAVSFHAFQTIDNRVSGALAISMIALAVTGLLLFAADGWRARTAALVPVLLGLTMAAVVVPRDEEVLNWPVDPVARELVCTDDAPTVCVSRVHANVLDALTPLAREGLSALAKLPGAPAAVHEETSRFGSDEVRSLNDGVVRIMIRSDRRGGLGHPAAVVYETVRGLGVDYDEKCHNRDEAAERAATYWLLDREPQSEVEVIPEVFYEDPEVTVEAVRLWHSLRELPDDEALARVTALRDALLACADLTGILSGGGAR
ncbi:hypothetical protein FF096_05950 [Micromonospora sp. CP22]|nr:hypothetical protein [Micromonospora sp. CP22]